MSISSVSLKLDKVARNFWRSRRSRKATQYFQMKLETCRECHLRNVREGWAADPKSEIAEGLRLLRLALSIDGNATFALSMLGRATAAYSGDFDTAREMVDRAVALNPNSSAYGNSEVGLTY